MQKCIWLAPNVEIIVFRMELLKDLIYPWLSFLHIVLPSFGSALAGALWLLSEKSYVLSNDISWIWRAKILNVWQFLIGGKQNCAFLSPPSGRKQEVFYWALQEKSSMELKFPFSVHDFFFFFCLRFCFVFTKYWFIERCVTLNWHIDISRNCGYCFEKYNPTLTDSYHYLEPLLRVSETSLINNESESYWGEQQRGAAQGSADTG